MTERQTKPARTREMAESEALALRSGCGKALIREARGQRKEPTESEQALWDALGAHRRLFQRQIPILGGIVDFYSPMLRLCVEIDPSFGSEKRDDYLSTFGLSVLRLVGKEVEEEPQKSVQKVLDFVAVQRLEEKALKTPDPLAALL